MNKRSNLNIFIPLMALILVTCLPVVMQAAPLQGRKGTNMRTLSVVKPPIGTRVVSSDSMLTITLVDKKQNNNYRDKATLDQRINSPKSVNIHPNGKKFYVNSLEGYTTEVYDFATRKHLKTINHKFNEVRDAHLWAKPSGLFPWHHYSQHLNTFNGKPVESTFSHGGKYLWVPYYRRSFDLNAQDPSAVAVIDTERDTIIRLMETGPLPKMIKTSPDGHYIAISHWGDNTVGLLDVSSDKPTDWHYVTMFIVDKQQKLNFPLNVAVDRDNGSGYALRGTIFTPDNRYLLVGCMGSGGGIAVIDIQKREYLGRVLGMKSNVRHMILSNGYLYLSINAGGMIQRIKLDEFLKCIPTFKDKKAYVNDWETIGVGTGARTISATATGRYIYAACFYSSKLYVVDTEKWKVVAIIDAESYPVGLAVSEDGQYVITTSQGYAYKGGEAVNVYWVSYKIPQVVPKEPEVADEEPVVEEKHDIWSVLTAPLWLLAACFAAIVTLVCALVFGIFKKKKRKRTRK